MAKKQKTELSESAKSDALDLRRAHEKAQMGFLDGVVALGKVCEAKQQKYAHQGSGTFLKVLKEADVPKSTAYRAMGVSKSVLPSLGRTFPITLDAAFVLTAPKAPPAATEEAVELAKSGEKITPAKARAIVKKHSEPKVEKPPKPADPDAWLDPLREPYKKAISQFNEMLRVFGKLADVEETGVWLHEPWARIRKSLTDAKTALSQVQPWSTCPDCKGKGCKDCRNSGHLTKFAWGNLPLEMRA